MELHRVVGLPTCNGMPLAREHDRANLQSPGYSQLETGLLACCGKPLENVLCQETGLCQHLQRKVLLSEGLHAASDTCSHPKQPQEF